MKQVVVLFFSLGWAVQNLVASGVPPKVPPLNLAKLQPVKRVRPTIMTKSQPKEDVSLQVALKVAWYEREKLRAAILHDEISCRLAIYTQAHKESCFQLRLEEIQSSFQSQSIKILLKLLNYYKNKCLKLPLDQERLLEPQTARHKKS